MKVGVMKMSDEENNRFKARIVSKKENYLTGDTVLFEAAYRGPVHQGFYDVEVILPPGSRFKSGSKRCWAWDPHTLRDPWPNREGELNGDVNVISRWSWKIPDDAPEGIYRIAMRIYEHFGVNNRPVLAEIEDIIMVLPDPEPPTDSQ
jgi:hypothetical protein